MTEEEKTKFATYNGMARNALIFGVPTMTLVTLLFCTLLSLFGGIFLFGAGGVVLPLLSITLIFVVKFKCESNSRAIDELMWDIKGGFLRILCHSTIVSFSSCEDTPLKRKINVQKFFKNHPDL